MAFGARHDKARFALLFRGSAGFSPNQRPRGEMTQAGDSCQRQVGHTRCIRHLASSSQPSQVWQVLVALQAAHAAAVCPLAVGLTWLTDQESGEQNTSEAHVSNGACRMSEQHCSALTCS